MWVAVSLGQPVGSSPTNTWPEAFFGSSQRPFPIGTSNLTNPKESALSDLRRLRGNEEDETAILCLKASGLVEYSGG